MDTDEKLRKISARIAEFFAPDSPVDISSMLFVAGLQTLGRPADNPSRDDKMALMHIGTCAVLEPYGYPQYELLKPIDADAASDGSLLKEALVNYFGDLL